MFRHKYACCFVVVALATLGGCSSQKAAKESSKANTTPDKIQGKAQLVLSEATAADSALSAGGPSVYLWDGTRRYRLFLRTPVEVNPGQEYIAEGINAQRVIDEIGDPDNGKNGYPLQASCDRVIRLAWPGLPFDVTDGDSSVLRERVKRYPARPVFLVNRLTAVSVEKDADSGKSKKDAESAEEDLPEITVPAEKQKALLTEGPAVQPAPLWAPEGGTVSCKLIINGEGKVSELETGSQLCEAVPWNQFKYQPTVQRGHPVMVKTEVEVRFDPRK